MARPTVEVLYFDGCPHQEKAVRIVQRIAAELRIEPEVRRVEVSDTEAAQRQRFLGSPTIRVNGRDVEPGAEHRDDFALACRVYQSPRGPQGQPQETWIRQALTEAST
jgi:glutaredoxin